MRRELAESYSSFLSQFRPMQAVIFKDDLETDKKIVALAIFCAHGRCAVERDRYSQTIEYIPEPEGPPRMAKQIKSLAMGVALAYGKNEIDQGIYSIIRKVGLDLLERRRTIIIEHLWKEKVLEFVGWQTTKEIADAVGIPSGSAKRILEDLQLVGVLNKRLELGPGRENEDSEGLGRKPYEWQIREQTENWIRASGVLNGAGAPF